MKLLLKFNLIFVAIGLAIVSWVAHSFLIDNARAQVLQQAELMIQSASSHATTPQKNSRQSS